MFILIAGWRVFIQKILPTKYFIQTLRDFWLAIFSGKKFPADHADYFVDFANDKNLRSGLHIDHCLLPIAYCPLLSVYPPETSHCQLPPAGCQLASSVTNPLGV